MAFKLKVFLIPCLLGFIIAIVLFLRVDRQAPELDVRITNPEIIHSIRNIQISVSAHDNQALDPSLSYKINDVVGFSTADLVTTEVDMHSFVKIIDFSNFSESALDTLSQQGKFVLEVTVRDQAGHSTVKTIELNLAEVIQ